jgi:hypothetical protein
MKANAIQTSKLGTEKDRRSKVFYHKLVKKLIATFNLTFENKCRKWKLQSNDRRNKIYFMNITSHSKKQLGLIVHMINSDDKGTIFPSINGGNSRANIIARLSSKGNLIIEAL